MKLYRQMYNAVFIPILRMTVDEPFDAKIGEIGVLMKQEGTCLIPLIFEIALELF